MFSHRTGLMVAFALFSWIVLWSVPAYPAPVAGDNEVEVAAGFFHSQGSETGALTADLNYGYYLTPGWEIGLRQALNYTFVDDARDAWFATTTPFLNYNFRLTDVVVPFLGAFFGAVWNDKDVSGTLGPQVGIKFFVGDQTYLGLRYRYEWFFDSLRGAGRNADNGNHVINLGVGFVWGGTRTTTTKPTR
jgi:hypothetical protein